LHPLRSVLNDLPASFVVFLVALPLCMGIAIASGTPPALGLITGIVGGLVVGVIAGSPLQVSGPAAGLAVLVFQLVHDHGLEALGPVVLVGGVIQVLAGLAALGQWFRAISPAVIHGMLAGIGVLIFLGQIHVMLDRVPAGGGLDNLVGLPASIGAALAPAPGAPHALAGLVGLLTLGVLLLWNALRPRQLRLLPGPLLAVLVAATVSNSLGWSVSHVSVPDNLLDAANLPDGPAFARLGVERLLEWGLLFAFVTSAESLLCAAAVDRMHDGPRTHYNRELVAQGIGNSICGALGALPMTGVIVRSSVNVKAGAKSRASAVLHGVWLLAFVLLLPAALNAIPTAALAAVLVHTGYKLVNLRAAREVAGYGRTELGIYLATLLCIVIVDLLTGVLLGLVLSLLKIVYVFAHVDIRVQPAVGDERRVDVVLRGSATFLAVPRISEVLERIAPGTQVHIHLEDVLHIDHACLEMLAEFDRRHERSGGQVVVEWNALKAHLGGPREWLSSRAARRGPQAGPAAP